TRDGVAWKLLTGANIDAVQTNDRLLRLTGFETVDAAAWFDPEAKARPTGPFVAVLGGAGGVAAAPPQLRFAAVWRKTDAGKKPPTDVTVTRDAEGAADFAGTWNDALAVDVEQPTGLTVAEQLAKARELSAAGWRLVALGVADSKLTASVWHRPAVVDGALEA